jgi:hypothetical protein
MNEFIYQYIYKPDLVMIDILHIQTQVFTQLSIAINLFLNVLQLERKTNCILKLFLSKEV